MSNILNQRIKRLENRRIKRLSWLSRLSDYLNSLHGRHWRVLTLCFVVGVVLGALLSYLSSARPTLVAQTQNQSGGLATFSANASPTFQFNTRGQVKSAAQIQTKITHLTVPVTLSAQVLPAAKPGQFVISIPPTAQMKPGKYRLAVTSAASLQHQTIEQDFLWGILALNTNKSMYSPGETAYLQMGVLNEYGHTMCKANLKLEITDPKSQTKTLTSKDGNIKNSDTCNDDNVTDNPDYFAYYQTGTSGKYQMRLTNLDNGYHISDFFEVKDSIPFDIERVGASRINPFKASYVMNLKITANRNFDGTILENVPGNFEISDISSGGSITDVSTGRTISWSRAMQNGDILELSYRYQAPKVSPQIFFLGPLEIWQENSKIFSEPRKWQLASDTPYTATGSGEWNTNATWGGSGHPIAGDSANIPSNYAITVSSSSAAAASVVFAATCTTGCSVTTSNGYTLSISGDISLTSSTSANTNATLAGTAAITAATITVGTDAAFGTTTYTTQLISTATSLSSSGALTINTFRGTSSSRYNNGTFALQSGTTAVSGTINFAHEFANVGTDTLTMATGAGSGTLNLSNATPWTFGTGTNTTTLNGGSATVNYTASGGGQNPVQGTTYTTLNVQNTSGTDTANGNITATTLTTAAGGTLNMVTYTLSITNITNNGIIRTQNTSATPITTGKTWGGTVTYDSTAAAQTVSSNTYTTLTFANTGYTATLGGTTTATTLTIDSGTLATSTNRLVVSGVTTVTGTLTLSGAGGSNHSFNDITISVTTGVWNNSGNVAVDISGGLTNNNTFTAGSNTYTFSGSGKNIAGSAAVSFATLVINAATNNTNAVSLTVTTALNGSNTLTQGLNSTLILNFTGALGISGLNASSNTNTVNYTYNGAQTVKAVSYSTLTLSTGGVKTMTSVATIGANLNVSGSATMTDNGALAITGALNYSSSGSSTLKASTNISMATFNQTGGTIVDNAVTITVSGTGAATWTETGTFTATGTVIFTGASPQIGASNFNHLTISVGTSASITGALDVNGNFSLTTGNFNANSQNQNFAGNFSLSNGTTYTKGGTLTFDKTVTSQAISDATAAPGQDLGAVTIGPATATSVSTSSNIRVTTLTSGTGGDDTFDISGDTLTIRGTGAAFTQNGTFTVTGSTVVYAGAGATNITATQYNNLTTTPESGSATYSLAGHLTNGSSMLGNLTISANATLSASGSNYNIALAGNWNNGDTYTANANTVDFNGSGSQTLNSGGTGAGYLFNNLTHSGAGILQIITNDLDVNGDFNNSNASGTFDANGKNMSIQGTYNNAGTFTAGAGTVTFDATAGTKTLAGTMTGTSAFTNVVFNDGGGTATFQPTANMTVNADFTLTDGILDLDTSDPIVQLGDDSGTGNVNLNGGSITASNSANFILNDNSTEFYSVGGIVLGNVVIGASPAVTNLKSDLVAASLTIVAGDTLNTKGYETDIGTGGISVAAGAPGGTFNTTDTGGGGYEGDGTIVTDEGNFAIGAGGVFTKDSTGAQVSLVKMDGGATRNFTSSSQDIGHFQTSVASTNIALQDALDVDNVTIDVNTTLDSNGFNITVGGNWSKSGAFTYGIKKVTFDSTTTATVSGSTTFYDLTLDATASGAKQINFTAGTTQTINNTFTLTGAVGKILTLRSTVVDSAWYFVISANMTSGNYIDVRDSQNITNGNRISAGANCINSGNNVPGWLFFTYDTLTTDKGSYPTLGETITVDATVYNHTGDNLIGTYIDYVIFIDANADNQPTAGETYMTSGCAGSGAWASGDYTFQKTLLNVNAYTSANDQQSCTNNNFPQNTTYTLWSKWWDGVATTYATKYVTFTSVPTLTEILFLLLVSGGVWFGIKRGAIKFKLPSAPPKKLPKPTVAANKPVDYRITPKKDPPRPREKVDGITR